MQQCSNCKCQVGSGISVCPYCGAQLPLQKQISSEQDATYIRPADEVQNGRTYRVTYITETPPRDMAIGNPVSAELPARYETSIYYSYPERERREHSTETILVALLLCMVVA